MILYLICLQAELRSLAQLHNVYFIIFTEGVVNFS